MAWLNLGQTGAPADGRILRVGGAALVTGALRVEGGATVVGTVAATTLTGALAWTHLTAVPATASRWPAWTEVTDKPTTATRWPTFAEVTSPPATATRWPTWAEVTGKPTTFSPSSHTHPWAEVTGAPTTATRWPTWAEVTSKPTTFDSTWASVALKPATATRWPTWGEVTDKPATFTPASHTHAAADITSGTFTTARIPNLPASQITSGTFALARIPNIDLARIPNLPASQITSGTVADARLPTTATRWPTWSEVTSKPSTFAPSAHTHAAADITSGTIANARLPTTATRWPTWGEVTSKPADLRTIRSFLVPLGTPTVWGNVTLAPGQEYTYSVSTPGVEDTTLALASLSGPGASVLHALRIECRTGISVVHVSVRNVTQGAPTTSTVTLSNLMSLVIRVID